MPECSCWCHAAACKQYCADMAGAHISNRLDASHHNRKQQVGLADTDR
jgi:hypothetical protein